MPSWLESWPFVAVYLFFVLGAAMRSQALYWAGRGVAAGVGRSRWSEKVEGPRTRRAVEAIERWGMPVIPLSFLTVGFQSAVHGAAGLLRLHWVRYTLWSVPGWLVWAMLWAGGGTAAVYGAALLAARSPWGLAGVVLLLLSVAAVVVARRRRARRASAPPDGAARLVPIDDQHDPETRAPDGAAR